MTFPTVLSAAILVLHQFWPDPGTSTLIGWAKKAALRLRSILFSRRTEATKAETDTKKRKSSVPSVSTSTELTLTSTCFYADLERFSFRLRFCRLRRSWKPGLIEDDDVWKHFKYWLSSFNPSLKYCAYFPKDCWWILKQGNLLNFF